MRWMQRDPIGHSGGVNIWEYANSNPVRYVDPDGLQVADVAKAAGAISIVNPPAGLAVAAVGVPIACYFSPSCRKLVGDAFKYWGNVFSDDDSEECEGTPPAKPGFKGGKKGKRDNWGPLEGRPGLEDFKDWWHRGDGKDGYDGPNLHPGDFEEQWNEWEQLGRPTGPKPKGKRKRWQKLGR